MTHQKEQPAGYPKVVFQDDAPAGEALPPLFHRRHLAILVSRSGQEEEWPPDPEDAGARACFEEGQAALYDRKDPGRAILCFRAAVMREPEYLKAWVALTIALVTENTPASLEDAERVLRQLVAEEQEAGIPEGVRRMLHTNLAFLYVHRARQAAEAAEAERSLRLADTEYGRAMSLSGGRDRVGTVAVRAYVALRLGEAERAEQLWRRARACAGSAAALDDYRAKYPELAELGG